MGTAYMQNILEVFAYLHMINLFSFSFYVLFVGLEYLNYISLWQVAAPASAKASTCPDTEVQLQG